MLKCLTSPSLQNVSSVTLGSVNPAPSPLSPVILWGHDQLLLLTGKYTNHSKWHLSSFTVVDYSKLYHM